MRLTYAIVFVSDMSRSVSFYRERLPAPSGSPPGLLEPLAGGKSIPDATLKHVLAMTDSLRAELPQMLEEHKKIRAAVEKLGEAARENRQ